MLFVVGRLQPNSGCRMVVALARHLNKLGYEVTMVCRSGSLAKVYPRDSEQRAGEYNPPVLLSRALSNNLRGRFNLRYLVPRVREINPDIVHVHGSRLAGVGARLARRIRKPYLLGIDDFLDPGQSLSISRRFIGKIIAPSDAVRVDLVNRIRLPRGSVEVVHGGVDTDYDVPQERKTAHRSKLPVVGTIGRLVESKGQEYFIRAANLLAMRGIDAHFIIAGDGPDRKRLHNIVSELDLVGSVTFARPPVDQLDVLQAIDIMVVPALKEALGLPAIEAMAWGIPVIATSAGGMFALIENRKTGILVPKGDPDALAREIEYLLEHPDSAAELAHRGRQMVAENFNIEATARHIATIYEAVLSGRGTKEAEATAASS